MDAATSADAPVGIDGERWDFETLYSQLREGVLSGDLPPGATLSQVRLAREYSVSRSPLREALRMLEREGLVVAQRGRRARIAPVSASDLEQLYSMGIVVEGLAIRLTAARPGQSEVEELEHHLGEMDALVQTRDFNRWEVPHRAFHRGLVAGAGERLVTSIDELSDHAKRYRRIFLQQPRAWSEAAAEHAAILASFGTGDGRAAAKLLATHYATTALTVCAALAPHYEPAGVREALRLVTEADGKR